MTTPEKQAAAKPQAHPQPDWAGLVAIVEAYVADYTCDDGEQSHTPTAHERFLIHDAVSGLINESAFVDAMQRRLPGQ